MSKKGARSGPAKYHNIFQEHIDVGESKVKSLRWTSEPEPKTLNQHLRRRAELQEPSSLLKVQRNTDHVFVEGDGIHDYPLFSHQLDDGILITESLDFTPHDAMNI